MPKSHLLFIMIVLLAGRLLQAQPCCSAGTPFAAVLDVNPGEAGQLYIGLNYEFTAINDVYYQDRPIEGVRRRSNQALLADVTYGLNRRWSLTGLFSLVQQQQQLNQPNTEGSRQTLTTRGVGDVLLLLKYNVLVADLAAPTMLAIGAGIKIPSGISDLRSDGILLPADLQPGSGSWDGLLWLYYSRQFFPSPVAVYSTFSFRYNGENNRFQSVNTTFSNYRFGHITRIQTGLSYRVLNGLDLLAQLEYRRSEKDRFAQQVVTNTGGQWLTLVPGLHGYYNNMGVRLTSGWPLYRKVEGVQLTNSYSLLVSFYWLTDLGGKHE